MSLSKGYRTELKTELKQIDSLIKTLEKRRQVLREQMGEVSAANNQTSLDKFKDEIRRQYFQGLGG